MEQTSGIYDKEERAQPDMQFEYEITPNRVLPRPNSCITGRVTRSESGGRSFPYSSELPVLELRGLQAKFGWPEFLLAVTSPLWCYAGVSSLFPGVFKKYLQTCLSRITSACAKGFRAAMNQSGFEVTEDSCSWRVQWPAVTMRSEDVKVFLLCSYGSMFIFGKRYLTGEQQQELRVLSGLGPPPRTRYPRSR